MQQARKDIDGSTVSADILHFARMEEAPNRIRELRLARKLSQQKLGDLIGVSKMTISDLERGEMKLDVDYMRRLAKALGVAATDLLCRQDNEFSLSAEERDLIERFRQATADERASIVKVAEALAPYRVPGKAA